MGIFSNSPHSGMGQLYGHNAAIFLNSQGHFLQTIDHFIGMDTHLPGACLTFQCYMGMASNNQPDISLGKVCHTIEQRVLCCAVKTCHCLVGGGSDKTVFYLHAVYPG